MRGERGMGWMRGERGMDKGGRRDGEGGMEGRSEGWMREREG